MVLEEKQQKWGPAIARVWLVWEKYNHVVAAMYRVEAAVRIGLTRPYLYKQCQWAEWLPNRRTIEPKKIKHLDFTREDFEILAREEKKGTISSFTKKEVWPTEKLRFKTFEYKRFCWNYPQSFPWKYIIYCGTQAKGEFCQRIYFSKNRST